MYIFGLKFQAKVFVVACKGMLYVEPLSLEGEGRG